MQKCKFLVAITIIAAAVTLCRAQPIDDTKVLNIGNETSQFLLGEVSTIKFSSAVAKSDGSNSSLENNLEFKEVTGIEQIDIQSISIDAQNIIKQSRQIRVILDRLVGNAYHIIEDAKKGQENYDDTLWQKANNMQIETHESVKLAVQHLTASIYIAHLVETYVSQAKSDSTNAHLYKRQASQALVLAKTEMNKTVMASIIVLNNTYKTFELVSAVSGISLDLIIKKIKELMGPEDFIVDPEEYYYASNIERRDVNEDKLAREYQDCMHFCYNAAAGYFEKFYSCGTTCITQTRAKLGMGSEQNNAARASDFKNSLQECYRRTDTFPLFWECGTAAAITAVCS